MKKNYRILTAFIVMLSFFTINMKSQISGTVTVNSSAATGSGNYASFGALASALNSNGINGPLTVNVLTGANSGQYNEQVQFYQITGTSATNTITINGNNNLLYYNTNSNPWVLSLDGTKYMYVHNLKMQSTNTSQGYACILSAGASYNYFKGCTFSVTPNSSNYNSCPFALSDSPYYLGNPYTPCNYNTVTTSTMFSGYVGVWVPGYYNPPMSTGNKILNCRITDFWYYGVFANYASNLTMKGCTIDRDTRTSFNWGTYVIYGYESEGFLFENNTIRDLYAGGLTNSSTTYIFYGIGSYAGDLGNRNTIRNNVVRDIKYNGYVYVFEGVYYTALDIYHNTISFGTGTAPYVYVFDYVQMAQGNCVVKNNIFALTNTSASYKVVWYYPNSVGTPDYNNYYLAGSNSYIAQTNSGSATTPAAWTSMSGDVNCWATDPSFANAAFGDLHPTNTLLNNLGTPLNLPYDNMNNGRSQTTPDVGALEFLSNNCSGTPAANTVTGQLVICPNDHTDLMVGTWSSDIGISYQWLSSPTSTAGPWSSISGENSVFYTTPNINTTTYYGVQIVCANAAGATTAAVAVSMATTVVSSVPYLEDFEGITANKLPNCSWSTSGPMGVNHFTKIGPGNSNQGPHSGTKYGVFRAAYVNGTNYFYTNGIQLNTGITYSTGVFYKTDNYNSSNITDFSIMLGTSQSPTGLVSLASSNGIASSGPYTSISNTFQVATSGLYYVAVRCKTNGNYGAQYLSWDDLSITIPCQYNPVNVTMSASSNTVCLGEEVGFTASGADSYTWSTGDNGNNMYNTPLASGVYTVTGTNNVTGCSSSVSQFISVQLSPFVIAYGSKPAICVGESVILMATGNANSYMWSNLQGAQSINVSPTVTTVYTVTGTNGVGCTAQSVYTVLVNNLPNVGVTSSDADQTVCQGDQVTLTGTGATSYQWAASTMFVQSAVAVVYPTSNIVYTVTGTDINGCQNSLNYALTVNVCEGLKENTLMAGLSVYPNPTNSELNVELNNASVKSIMILDLTGRVVSSVNSDSQVTKVNMSNLANGVYYVRISSDNATSVVKVVKQ